VPDQLVDPLEKMKIGFGLDVEWSGAKDRRVQPGPGLPKRLRRRISERAEEANAKHGALSTVVRSPWANPHSVTGKTAAGYAVVLHAQTRLVSL